MAGIAVAASLSAIALPTVASGQCNSQPVVQNDVAETYNKPLIVDVLANDSDSDGEALSLSVVSSTCAGSTTVTFDLLRYAPSAPLVSPCQITYRATDERGAFSQAIVTINAGSPVIFADGFESGDTVAWTFGCPPTCPFSEPDQVPDPPIVTVPNAPEATVARGEGGS